MSSHALAMIAALRLSAERASGLQRLQALKPSARAEAMLSWMRTFFTLAVREGHEGLQ
jgi:predicted protein tyrosine phosphatase